MAATKDIDRGWKRIRAQLLKAGGAFTKVGVQQGETDEEGTDLVKVAAANEFGTTMEDEETGEKKVRIPERSFIRSTTDEQRSKVERIKRRILEKMVDEGADIKTELGLLGEFMQKEIQKKIVDLKVPENAESTKKKKGSDNPLVDQGQLQQSIRHVEVVP
jgi:phage gpG-like protein